MGSSSLLKGEVARAALVLALLVAFTSSGCGDGDAPAAPAGPVDVTTCNIGDSSCQREIYDSVAAMLDAEGYSMPGIRTISVEQHEQEVRNGLDLDDLTGEDAETRGLRLLGFIPEVSDSLSATQAEYFISRVAAYYSRGNNSITVIDRDYEPGSAQTLLAHEFIHAIQNAQFNLSTVSRGADTEDGVIGVRSVIEGDAVYTSFAWIYDQLGYEREEIDWDAIHLDRTDGLRESVADTEVALIDTASSFPYAFGFRFVTALTLFGGLPARAVVFLSPPGTTADVMGGFFASPPEFDFPEVAHPAPVAGDVAEFENRFGAWYVYGFLVRQGMADEEAWATALRWVGDELAIYDDGEEVVAVWRVRFDDAADAGALTDQVNADSSGAARSAVAFEGDAFVFAAETDETLLAWAQQPLDEMTASVVLKGAPNQGGAVSVGTCLQFRDFSLPTPPPLLQ